VARAQVLFAMSWIKEPSKMESITKNWDIMIMGENEKLRKLNWIYNDDMIMGKKEKIGIL